MDWTTGLVISGSVIIGIVFTYLRSLRVYLFRWVSSYFSSTIEIRDSDFPFWWFEKWLQHHAGNVTHWRTRASVGDNTEDQQYFQNVSNQPRVQIYPGDGIYYFRYKGRRIIITRHTAQHQANSIGFSQSPSSTARREESFHIRFLTTKKEFIEDFVTHVRDFACESADSVIIVHRFSIRDNSWNDLSYKKLRPLDSVYLANNVLTDLATDIRQFMGRQKEYNVKSIPFRRGYLISGPPGNGKTSTILAIASAFKLNIYVIDLSAPGLTDDTLSRAFSDIAGNSIVVLEDIDSVFDGRESVSKNDNARSWITFSGVLNILDGISSKEGRILFMTSNHPEKLDSALIRPGRVDVRVFIDYPLESQIRRLVESFYGAAEANTISIIVKTLAQKNLSMATIQGFLLKHEKSVESAFADVERFVKNPSAF